MNRRAWLRLIGGGALLTLAAVAATLTYRTGRFDAARWQAQRGSDALNNPRIAMIGDLEQRLRPGMTRAEVLALLGEPESQSGGRAVYALGASPYGVDYEFFVIEFDDAGMLLRHRLMRG
jgi:hypothetical protein